MLKQTMIATALFATAFLAQPQAQAAPAIDRASVGETSSVQLVRGGGHGDWRRHERRHERRHDRREFRHHDRLRHHGYRNYRGFRWDGRGFVTRAYHPRYGWVWVRVSPNSGRPVAHWR